MNKIMTATKTFSTKYGRKTRNFMQICCKQKKKTNKKKKNMRQKNKLYIIFRDSSSPTAPLEHSTNIYMYMNKNKTIN